MLPSCSLILRRSVIGRAMSSSCFSTTSTGRGGARPNPTLMVAAGIAVIGGSGIGFWLLPSPSFAESNCPQSNDPSAQEKRPKYLIGDSYRRRVFFNYEKRIRLRSPPEKIFEYFASFRSPEGEVFMYPADLMRAVVPVFPPSESNLVRDGHLRGEQHPEAREIDREEFKKVMALMRSYNRQGTSHRDGLRIGLKVGRPVENGGLLEYFFGKDGDGRLQHDKFVQFLRDLHDEIVRLEFQHYDYHSSGTISSGDFALSMVASADINHVSKFLDRVNELNSNVLLKEMRISFEEFKAFAELRKKLQPLALAIFSFGKVNGLLTKQDFQRAASHVCGISVTDNVVDIIFHIFDANRDGSLSAEEFLTALQRRETDIRQPSATGVMSLFSCCLNCAKTCTFSKVPV